MAIGRGLFEETGCRAGDIISLGSVYLGGGRMHTPQHAFFAPGVEVVGRPSGEEQELEAIFVSFDKVRSLIATGGFPAHLEIFAAARRLFDLTG